MRLFLAVAVLMLALVAYTEAQDEPIEDRFARIGDKITEFGRSVADGAKATFDKVHNSDTAVNVRNWFEEKFQQVRDAVQ